MKRKDYFRLAKISLKARRKTTKSTVRGITFGLILLIPVVFIGMGVFGDLNAKINKNPDVLYSKVTAAAKRTGIADAAATNSENFRVSFDTAKGAFDKYKTSEKIIYEQVTADFNFNIMTRKNETSGYGNRESFGFSIGGEAEKSLYVDSFRSQNGDGRNDYGDNNEAPTYPKTDTRVPFAAIFDLKNSGRSDFTPKKYKDRFGDNIYVPGCDKGFSANSKGEVIISEKFIQALNSGNDGTKLTPSSFYNKTLSISFRDISGYNQFSYSNVYINPDSVAPAPDDYMELSDRSAAYPNPGVRYFFKNYKVVGVIRDEVTEWAMNVNVVDSYGPAHYLSNVVYLTTDSLIDNSGKALDPVITQVSKPDLGENNNNNEIYYVATYETDDLASANEEYICLGSAAFSTKEGGGGFYSGVKFFADPKTYAELKSIAGILHSDMDALFGESGSWYINGLFLSRIYSDMDMMYNVFTYMILFLAVMGGIIFFASMVNLFNSIVHSVDSRKGYLGVLRAVGGKRSMINNLYFAESLSIFTRAVFWILGFAGAICIGIKLLMDFVLKYVNRMMPFSLSIGWIYIPVAIGACLSVLLLLGFLFSYGCSWKVSREQITKTLAQ